MPSWVRVSAGPGGRKRAQTGGQSLVGVLEMGFGVTGLGQHGPQVAGCPRAPGPESFPTPSPALPEHRLPGQAGSEGFFHASKVSLGSAFGEEAGGPAERGLPWQPRTMRSSRPVDFSPFGLLSFLMGWDKYRQ